MDSQSNDPWAEADTIAELGYENDAHMVLRLNIGESMRVRYWAFRKRPASPDTEISCRMGPSSMWLDLHPPTETLQ